MRRVFRYRAALVSVGLIAAFVPAAKAPAALDMFVGARKVVKSQPVSACNAAAKAALESVLQSAQELGSGDSGEWEGFATPDSANGSTGAAAIHCYPIPGGYLATLTCAVQVPPYPESASSLCGKLSAAFDAKAGNG